MKRNYDAFNNKHQELNNKRHKSLQQHQQYVDVEVEDVTMEAVDSILITDMVAEVLQWLPSNRQIILAARVSNDWKAALKKVDSFSMPKCRLNAQVARRLACLINPRALDLFVNRVGDEGVYHLSRALTNLETLNISLNRIGDEGVAHLSSLVSIRTLKISANEIGDEGARHLASLTNITALDVSRNNIREEGARHIASLANIESLNMALNSVGYEGAHFLSTLTKLLPWIFRPMGLANQEHGILPLSSTYRL